MIASRWVLICLCLLSAVAFAQHSRRAVSVPEIPVDTSGEPEPTEEPVGGLFGAIQCDAEGGVYVRSIGDPGSGSAFANPLIRIAPDGSIRRYPLRTLPGIGEDYLVRAYSIDPGGQVYQIVQAEQSGERGITGEEAIVLSLVGLSNTGEFRWKSVFGFEFEPVSLVALPNDHFLVVGMRRETGAKQPTPFSVIVNRDAQIQRTLERATPAKRKPLDVSAESGGGADSAAISLDIGSAQAADDGMLYVLRTTGKPTISVYTPNGELDRSFELQLPFPKAKPFEMFVSQGRVLVVYQSEVETPTPSIGKLQAPRQRNNKDKQEFKMLYAVYNAQTGELQVSYRPGENPGILACFAGKQLTLLKPTRMGRFGILQIQLP